MYSAVACPEPVEGLNGKMAYVYIIESVRDGRYYIGSTINIEERLRHHLYGGTPSTRRFGRIRLVFKQYYPSLREARTVERKLKGLKRKDYLKKIVQDGYIKNS